MPPSKENQKLKILDDFLLSKQEELHEQLHCTKAHDERCMIHAKINFAAMMRQFMRQDLEISILSIGQRVSWIDPGEEEETPAHEVLGRVISFDENTVVVQTTTETHFVARNRIRK